MKFCRQSAERHGIAQGSALRGLAAAALLIVTGGQALPADPFPFDRELLLDAAPMRPVKRVPILTVAPDGNAIIDLWCKTVRARVELSDSAIRIDPAPLPEALPAVMSNGQCSPARMDADMDLLAALTQVTGWSKQGGAIVLAGPKQLRFRSATN